MSNYHKEHEEASPVPSPDTMWDVKEIHAQVVRSKGVGETIAVIDAASSGSAETPPITWIEQEIANILGNLLGTSQIGRDQSFLESGGHSLQAIQALSRIREEFGIELPITVMFDQNLCVRTLSSAIERAYLDEIGAKGDQALIELRSFTKEQIQELRVSSKQDAGISKIEDVEVVPNDLG